MGTETSVNRDVPTEHNWQARRARIEDLYLRQDKSLTEVLQILSDEDGFKASSSQLKRRLKAWGLTKNLTSQQMDEIAQTLMRTNERALTRRSSDKEVAKVNGQSVPLSKVKRYQKRRQLPQAQKGASQILPSADASKAPNVGFEKETYGLNYDWMQEDDLSIPIKPGLEFRNLFEDFDPVPSAPGPTNTAATPALRKASSYPEANRSSNTAQPADQPPKRKRSRSPNSSDQDGKLLACPFVKRDPTRNKTFQYQSCKGALLPNIPRLKQHLYRVHRSPQDSCPRCYEAFQSFEELQNHVTGISQCELSQHQSEHEPDSFSDIMSQAQQQAIKVRQFGKDRYDQWYDIFQILFPGEALPASPYAGDVDTPSDDAVHHFVNFFKVFGTSLPTESQRRYLLHLLPDGTRRVVESAIKQTLPQSEDAQVSVTGWTQVLPSPQTAPGPTFHAEPEVTNAMYVDMQVYKFPQQPLLDTSIMVAEPHSANSESWQGPSMSMDWAPVYGTAPASAAIHTQFHSTHNIY